MVIGLLAYFFVALVAARLAEGDVLLGAIWPCALAGLVVVKMVGEAPEW